jgi:hypothetical protein
MTDTDTRRTQACERRRKHRRLKLLGKGAYYVRPHKERLAEALRKSGMPAEDTKIRTKVEAALDGLIKEWVLIKLRE